MIFAAAIKYRGKIYTGQRHYQIIRDIIKLGYNKVVGEQGFINTDGEFLNREDAAKEALRCGQIKKLKYHSKQLFSEDLW